MDARLKEKEPGIKNDNNLTILDKLLKQDKKLLFGTISDILIGGVDTVSNLVNFYFQF